MSEKHNATLILEGEVVTSHELFERARDYADRVAPRPSKVPAEAGVAGLMTVGVILAVFMGLARLPVDRFGFAITVTSALGFAGPYLYVRTGHQRNSEVMMERYRELTNLAKPMEFSDQGNDVTPKLP